MISYPVPTTQVIYFLSRPTAALALSRTLSPELPCSWRSWLRPTLSPTSWPVDFESSLWTPLQRAVSCFSGRMKQFGAYRASLSPVSVKASLVFC